MKTKFLFSFFFIFALITIWEFLVYLNIINSLFLPAPSKILMSLFSNINSLLLSTAITLKHIAVGYIIGVTIAILLGFILMKYNKIESMVYPLILGIGAVPVIAYIPLFILWFGLNEMPIYVCSTIGAFYPVFLATIHGIKRVNRSYIEVAQNFKIKAFTNKIIFPASLPYISNGLRQSIQFVFLITPPAEMIIKGTGLGGFIWQNADLFRIELVILGMVTLGIIGFCFFKAYAFIERKYLLKWMDVKKHA